MPFSLRNILRPVAHLLPTGMTVPILTGPLKGRKWIVGAAAGSGKGLSVVINQSEPAQVYHARKIMNQDFICFDIGANVGFYTLLFSQYAQSVYAFEPLPRNLNFLERLIDINKINNVAIIRCAVSDETREGYFLKGEDHSLGKLDANGDVPVSVITCDQFVAETGVIPNLIKIDVEGSEVEVLRGARCLLASSHPTILLSVHSDRLRSDCLTLLRKLEYRSILPLDAKQLQEATEFAIQFNHISE